MYLDREASSLENREFHDGVECIIREIERERDRERDRERERETERETERERSFGCSCYLLFLYFPNASRNVKM